MGCKNSKQDDEMAQWAAQQRAKKDAAEQQQAGGEEGDASSKAAEYEAKLKAKMAARIIGVEEPNAEAKADASPTPLAVAPPKIKSPDTLMTVVNPALAPSPVAGSDSTLNSTVPVAPPKVPKISDLKPIPVPILEPVDEPLDAPPAVPTASGNVAPELRRGTTSGSISIGRSLVSVTGSQPAGALTMQGWIRHKETAAMQLDGLYAQVSGYSYVKRLPPLRYLSYNHPKGRWFIAESAEDFHGAVAIGPEGEEALATSKDWNIAKVGGALQPAPGIEIWGSENYILKTGFMTKSPPTGVGKGWKNRFFVLLGPSQEAGEGQLLYFEDDKTINLKEPKGGIFLASVQDIGPGDGPTRQSFKGSTNQNACLRLTLPNRIFEMVAESPRVCRMWTQVITGVVKSCLEPENKEGRVIQGNLAKVGKNNSNQPRWATLDSQSLKFFLNEDESCTLKDIESEIPIRNITEIVPIPESAYMQLVLAKQVIKLKADSVADAKEWHEGLVAQIRLKLKKPPPPIINFAGEAGEAGGPTIIATARDAEEFRVGGDDSNRPQKASGGASEDDPFAAFKGGAGGLGREKLTTDENKAGYISVRSNSEDGQLDEDSVAAAAEARAKEAEMKIAKMQEEMLRKEKEAQERLEEAQRRIEEEAAAAIEEAEMKADEAIVESELAAKKAAQEAERIRLDTEVKVMEAERRAAAEAHAKIKEAERRAAEAEEARLAAEKAAAEAAVNSEEAEAVSFMLAMTNADQGTDESNANADAPEDRTYPGNEEEPSNGDEIPSIDPQKLLALFHEFDKDGNGSIDSQELLDIMSRLGVNLTTEAAERMIDEADADGNGNIDFEEFSKLCAYNAEREMRRGLGSSKRRNFIFSAFGVEAGDTTDGAVPDDDDAEELDDMLFLLEEEADA